MDVTHKKKIHCRYSMLPNLHQGFFPDPFHDSTAPFPFSRTTTQRAKKRVASTFSTNYCRNTVFRWCSLISSTILPLFFCNYLFHRTSEVRYLTLDYVPHQFVINPQIVMDELIPRPGHLPPLDLRVSGTEVLGICFTASPMISRLLTNALFMVSSARKAEREIPAEAFVRYSASARICSQKLMDGFIVRVFFDIRADKRADGFRGEEVNLVAEQVFEEKA
jgi:hypothetical protein